jgi:hypothetical protein
MADIFDDTIVALNALSKKISESTGDKRDFIDI